MRQNIVLFTFIASTALTGGIVNEASALTFNLNSGDNIAGNATYIVNGPGFTNVTAFDEVGNVRAGTYLANSATSRWIGPTPTSGLAGAANAVPAGNYTFATTFDLTGFDITTATISNLLIASDNSTTAVRLNGNLLTIPGFPSTGFGAFNSFSPDLTQFRSFLNSGSNTLAFTVNNAGGSPSSQGFRTEFAVTVVEVPFEFSPMLGLGLLGAFAARKKIKNAKNTLFTKIQG
jgi:hypothetical protein